MVTGLRGLAWLVGAALLVAACVSAAAFVDGGDRNVLVVLLAALAGWVIPLTAGALLLFTLSRHRRSAVAAAVALVACTIWLRPFPHGNGEVSAADVVAGRAVELTVLTQNVLVGQVPAVDLVALVRRERPDVLVLTELTGTLVTDLDAAGLGDLLPYRHLAAKPWEGDTGIWSAHPVAGTPVPGIWSGHDVVVETPGGDVRLLGVHPSPPLKATWAQDFDRLARHLESTAGPDGVVGGSDGLPVVVCGDFNATRYNAPMRRLLDLGLTDAAAARTWSWQQPTWPVEAGSRSAATATVEADLPGLALLQRIGSRPLLRLDQVLVPRSAEVLKVRTIRMADTDHLGLLVRVRLAH